MRTLVIGRARYDLSYEYRPPGALRNAYLVRQAPVADACILSTAFFTAELAHTAETASRRVLLSLSADCGDEKLRRVLGGIEGETECLAVTETEAWRVAGGMRMPCLIVTDLVGEDGLVGVYRRDGWG